MEWISVEDRLPESNQAVLVYGSNNEIVPARFNGRFNEFVLGAGWLAMPIQGTTHWMPLPDPPTEPTQSPERD